MTRSEPATRRSVHLALLVVQVLFGLWPVVGVYVMRVVSPAALVGIRTLVGAPLLLLGAGLARAPRPRWADLPALAGLAFLGISLNQILYAEGLRRAGAVNAVVLTALIPVITLLVGVALGREAPPWSRRLGIVAASAGVWLLVGAERFELSSERTVGNLLILANTTSYALYLVLARPTIARLGPLGAIGWIFFFGALEALPFTGPALLATSWAALTPAAAWALAFIVVGPTVGTYFLNAYALRSAPSSLVATYIGLQPLVGALGSAVFLGEPPTARTMVAAVVIIGGVVWACR